MSRCRIPFLALALAALPGCAAFHSSTRLDMGKFAEDMIAVAGEVQYSLGQRKAVYLRDYLDTPELVAVQDDAGRARALVRGVIGYSIQLVTVGDSSRPDHDKAQALAGYLEEVLPPVIEGPPPKLDLTRAEVDSILAEVRAQTRYLDAIGAAQPIVDEVALVSGSIFDDLKGSMDTAVDAVRLRVEERYRDVRNADAALEYHQVTTVYQIGLLRDIRLGDPEALGLLLAEQPSLAPLVDARDGVDGNEMRAMEDRMLEILTRLSAVRDQLAPDIEMYYRQQQELDDIDNVWNAELRKARVSIIAWARAHKRMAQGVTDPADIDVLGIARKAAGTMVPL